MKIAIALFTIIILFILFPYPLYAIENYQEGSLLFSDDFNAGNTNKWTIDSGTWGVDSGKQLYGFGSGTLILGRIGSGSDWDNYRIELDLKSDTGVDQGIGFRKKDFNNTYELTLRFGDGNYNTPEILLVRVENGIKTNIIDTHSVPLANQKFYHLKIDVVGDHIQAWLDSTLLFDLNDTNTPLKKGSIYLSYWTGYSGLSLVRFDNVKVISLNKIKLPVIFIPGIGGSELKLNSNTFWNEDDGHGGIFSRNYLANEKIWINTNEAIKIGTDDYFDILRLKSDGQTSVADIQLTNTLTPHGYNDIQRFFTDQGYTVDQNFFVFNYDWRKDIGTNQENLNQLVEYIKQKTGQSQINIVAHSMGGLVARNYISNPERATNVNKLIELGVPHLGSVKALKSLLYGTSIGQNFLGLFNIGISGEAIKDVSQNLPSMMQLMPSKKYYDFLDDKNPETPYPFFDDRDINKDTQIGPQNYSQLKEILRFKNINMNVYSLSENFHNLLDESFSKKNPVNIYTIAGSGQPTLGQIKETWFIKWPINFIEKRDEVFINGDETVPLYSATLKSPSLDLSNNSKIYYVEQTHSDLVNYYGQAMGIVKTILNEGDLISLNKEKVSLDGQLLSIDKDATLDLYNDNNQHTGLNDQNDIETNIPNTYFDAIDDKKYLFIKKKTPPVKVKITNPTAATILKMNFYAKDQINKIATYNVPANKTSLEIQINTANNTPPTISTPTQQISPTIITGENINDTTPPSTNHTIERSSTIILTPQDTQSGVMKTEYSLDNGQTVHLYDQPIVITQPGSYTIQFSSTDNLGNQETPKTISLSVAGSTTNNISTSTTVSANPQPPISNVIKSIAQPLNPKIETRVLGETITNTNPAIIRDSSPNERSTIKTKPHPLTFLVVLITLAGSLSIILIGSFFIQKT